ncbi:DUF6390 family protein [Kribbella sindirgiensis]|uniref:DUF6390 family protein n=1 Tax=Kribbella sindirgiensis TaxID=1124744 RepID=UPI00192DAF38|nr:DUF6390 family protein [Kribbella sindirgiensis]
MVDVSGPLLFAQYAYPPNALGYCGPDDSQELLEYVGTGTTDRGLVALARQFHGAWPYLSLIAAASGRDPLDARVVEAYWIGNRLLDCVNGKLLAAHLTDRFTPAHLRDPATLAVLGGRPHHNFHVFAVYPWVGLLRNRADEPLRVLDSCRISWGTVLAAAGDTAVVRIRPLRYDSGRLRLGEPVARHLKLHQPVDLGSQVSVHWNWICGVLTPAQRENLRRITDEQLSLVNNALGRPSTGDALEPAHHRAII